MSGVYKPSDVNDDNIAQWESNKDCSLDRVIPVLKRSIDRKQHEQNEVKNPIKSKERRSLSRCQTWWVMIWPLLEHDDSIFLNVLHVHRIQQLLLAWTQLPNMWENLSVEEIFVAIERIIWFLEFLMVKPVNLNPVVNWPLKILNFFQYLQEVNDKQC